MSDSKNGALDNLEKSQNMSFKERNNFGVKGWILVIYLMISFFLITGVTADLMNATIPAWAELKGWNVGILYGYGTIAGLTQLVGTIVFGNLVKKTGARKLGIVLTAIATICFLCWRFVDSLPAYLFMYCVMMVSISGAAYIVNSNIIANWFPTKKGMVMGWATMGAQLSGVVGVALFTTVRNTFSLFSAYTLWAIFPLAMFLFMVFFIRNNPEEKNFFPDNDKSMTHEMAQKLMEEGREYEKNSQWTTKKLLTTRHMWIIGYSAGVPLMMCIGVMSSFILRASDMGIDEPRAIVIMAIATALGIPGSYLIGFLDSKFSTHFSLRILYVFSIVALILNLLGSVNIAFYYIGVVVFAMTLGGGNNMPTSMISSVFGRYDFVNGYRMTYPVVTLLTTFGFTIVGMISEISGGTYTRSYIILIIMGIVGLLLTWAIPKKCIGRN